MLDKILETKAQEVRHLYESGYDYKQTVKQRQVPSYSFIQALQNPHHRSALIAEVKKASPSKGVIREDFDPVHIAQLYERAGADCLSVLTDETYFQGHASYIAQIKESVKLPILRKDFIIDPIQVQQSVELGADAILLIAKALPIDRLLALYNLAHELGLDCLIEIESRTELDEVLAHIKPAVLGINNRDLRTFTTSPEKTKQLLPFIPKEMLVISESGIQDAQTIRDLEQHGVAGFLIGEYLMRQTDTVKAVEQLYV